MKTLSIFSTLLLASTLAWQPAHADIASDAIAATQDLYDQLNASAATHFARYLPPQGFTEYNADSDKLNTMTMEYFNAVMKSGVKLDLHATELKAQAVGDAVIVTGYRVGTITPPGAAPISSRQLLTFVWSKDKDQLKVRHVHLAQAPTQ